MLTTIAIHTAPDLLRLEIANIPRIRTTLQQMIASLHRVSHIVQMTNQRLERHRLAHQATVRLLPWPLQRVHPPRQRRSPLTQELQLPLPLDHALLQDQFAATLAHRAVVVVIVAILEVEEPLVDQLSAAVEEVLLQELVLVAEDLCQVLPQRLDGLRVSIASLIMAELQLALILVRLQQVSTAKGLLRV